VSIRFTDLWRWDGKVSRKTYALAGFIGVAIKHNLDRLIAGAYFHRPMDVFSYWAPLGKAARLGHLSSEEVRFVSTLLLLALPFIWVGVTMTVRRLRDAGQPVWLAVLFFVPYVNLLFFAAMCLLPSRELLQAREASPWPGPRPLDQIIPRSALGSAVLAIAVTAVLGLLFALLGTSVMGAYGWSLFVALPFCLGTFSVLVYSYHARRSFWACMSVSLLPVVVLGAVLIAVAVEGVICVAMAAPLAMILTMLGGMLGYRIQSSHWGPHQSPVMLSIVLLLTPWFMGLEHFMRLQAEAFRVQSSIEVNAPPEVVWQKVVAFAEIPPPKEMLFRAGVAYPIRAEISGRGAGAVRRCVFSTGPFVEPIEIWDEPRLLKFSVTENPAPMNELSPYANVRPPHLHGYFVSRQGQFSLTPLPGGRTHLEGTTWYQHTMWPETYWHLWSDYIIHRIHLRVLNHIRQEAESPAAQPILHSDAAPAPMPN
jgi:uncharacterized membrane protein YhaH (DUF805 family)